MSLIHAVSSRLWAITPEMLRVIRDVSLRMTTPDDRDAARQLRQQRTEHLLDMGAISTVPGTRLEGTRMVTMRGNTAVLPIIGPITRYASLFSDVSGMTSVDVLARDFSVALTNPDVQNIALVVDSPGGEVAGINELASIIRNARDRKHIAVYADGAVGSAAYWLASGAHEIWADATAELGSIGIVGLIPTDDDGLYHEVVSSHATRKRPDLATDAGRAVVQQRIDDAEAIFVTAVAAHRGLSVDAIHALHGDMLIAHRAIAAGLADRIGSFEALISHLNGKDDRMTPPVPGTTARNQELLRALLSTTVLATDGTPPPPAPNGATPSTTPAPAPSTPEPAEPAAPNTPNTQPDAQPQPDGEPDPQPDTEPAPAAATPQALAAVLAPLMEAQAKTQEQMTALSIQLTTLTAQVAELRGDQPANFYRASEQGPAPQATQAQPQRNALRDTLATMLGVDA